MAPSYFIRGARLGLRAVADSDAEAYLRWLDDAAVTEYLEMGLRPARRGEREAFLRLANESEDAIVFAMDSLADGHLVGTCGLYLVQWACRRAQFNILIGEPAAWGRGYGAEATGLCLDYAFAKLNLNSVQLGVNADNKRAVRCYEKAGFVHEGMRRQFIYRNGRYYDMAVMSVLRDEYDATR